MTLEKLAGYIDHTLLKQDATWPQIAELCNEAARYGAASVCIPPSYVARAAAYLGGRVPVCTVIGFPNGYSTAAVKAAEAADAVKNGADEIDMVINVGDLKSGDEKAVADEIRAVKAACGEKTLKVIIECCLLTENEKRAACRCIAEGGADYVKTSTGFSTGGATVEDVKLLRECVGPDVGVKAAGGIKTPEQADTLMQAGASRIGSSGILKVR